MNKLSSESDKSAPRGGLLLLQVFILGLFCVFALRFWYLQIHRSEEFSELSRENRLRKDAVYAPRGLIRDRNGVLLASNEPAYALGLVRDECPDVEATLDQVSMWTGIPRRELAETFQEGRRKLKPFQPIVLASNISPDLLAMAETLGPRWPGLEIVMRPNRKYHYGTLMAHILGYVAEADEEEIDKDPGLALGDQVGKQGLEVVHEHRLRGQKGLRHAEVDATGRHLKQSVVIPPKAGEDLTLSIDLGVQELGMEQLDSQNRTGAVVVMDPDTGRLLALVTAPSYDSNAFARGLSKAEWNALSSDSRHPLQNRAIQSVYPPGSVFKLVMAGAGFASGMLNPREEVVCRGFVKLGSHTFRCWKHQGHGPMDLMAALIQSCDVYFYRLGERLTVDRMSDYSFKAGFGNRTGIDLPHENPGIIPTRKWKRKRFGERWQGGENLNMAIGQGYTLVSPLQVARYVAAVVNGGKLMKPLLLEDAEPVVQGELPITSEQIEFIREAMVQTVDSPRGTARRLRMKGVVVGGKTGTAQVVRLTDRLKGLKDEDIPYRLRDHAWMASFAERGEARYVCVVMVEHGLHGSSGAGPVVKAMYDYLFQEGEAP